MSFNIGYSCHTITNINHGWQLSLQLMTYIRIKQDTEPWMCSEILDLIKQRDYYLKMFKQSKSSTDIAQHHMLRNQVTHKIKKAKAQFIKTSIGSFHLKSPKKSANLNGSDPDFDESAYIWSL